MKHANLAVAGVVGGFRRAGFCRRVCGPRRDCRYRVQTHGNRFRKWACRSQLLTTRDIEDMGLDDYLDFAVRVPNLGTAYQADGRFDANAPAIRGIFGSGDAASAATTGFYIDDVPVSVALHPRVIDLERVEVLARPPGLAVWRAFHGRYHSAHHPTTQPE